MSRGAKFLLSTAPLILIDIVLAALCFMIAFAMRYNVSLFSLEAMRDSRDLQAYLHLIILSPFIRAFMYSQFGVYETTRRGDWGAEKTFSLFKAISLGTGIIIVVTFLYRGVYQYREYSYSRMVFVFDWLLNLLIVTGVHSLIRTFQSELRRRGLGVRRIAIQGVGETGQALADEAQRFPGLGYDVAGYIDDKADEEIRIGNRVFQRLGGTDNILDVINRHRLDEIVLTSPGALGERLMDFIEECDKVDVVVKMVPDLYGIVYRRKAVEELAGLPVIQVNEIAIVGFARVLKRAEDVVISTVSLLILSPLLAFVAALIKMDSPGPVFFKQERVGKNGRVFTLYKFRSMFRDAEQKRNELDALNVSDGPLFKMWNDPRITRVGRIVRKTSIDELPQLWNVLKGQMSLVGPRPLPASDIGKYGEWQQGRFTATPGITGLWQVNRTVHTAEEMLKWDIYYVENWSLWLDFKILLKTIAVVLMGKGAY
jgi:exopolysaccharide biosynthesis polyprenyl glycosylphosphotransferase